jgi:hypothetical protein
VAISPRGKPGLKVGQAQVIAPAAASITTECAHL